MPALSQKQQKFMGLVLAYKRGEVPASNVSKNVKQVAAAMSEKELEKYAGTKHKGLPKKAEGLSMPVSELKQIIKRSVKEVLNINEAVETVEPNTEEDPLLTPEQKKEFMESVSRFNEYGDAIYRGNDLKEAYKNIKKVVKFASKHITEQSGDWFDTVTLGRHSKKLTESMKIFEKTVAETIKLQQRLEAMYEDMGQTLGKYYEIDEKAYKSATEGKIVENVSNSEILDLVDIIQALIKKIKTENKFKGSKLFTIAGPFIKELHSLTESIKNKQKNKQ